jgi:hypothetical protein
MTRAYTAEDAPVSSPGASSNASSPGDEAIGIAEGRRILPDLDGMEGYFYVCDVMCGDRAAATMAAGAAAFAAAPTVGLVLLSAGPERLVVHCRVPAERTDDRCTATRLVREALAGMSEYVVLDGADDCIATGVVEADEAKGREPFADKDEARNTVASYMHEEGLFGDDSDDEYEDEGDDGGGEAGRLGF